jgi:chromosome partitioning protein
MLAGMVTSGALPALVVYSEKGGVGKTTLTALMAMAAATAGLNVAAVDMDPRATLTEVMRAEFAPGMTVDAILAAEDPEGWAAELLVPSAWHPRLRVLPSERSLGNREGARVDHAEHRLATALTGVDADLVIVDTPPRPGGVLVLSALAVPGARVLYSATPDQDGLDGIAQGHKTVEAARKWTNPKLDVLGIAITRVDERTVDARRCLDEARTIYDGLVLEPVLPERVIVREARAACDWPGNYERGAELAKLTDDLWTNVRGRLAA